MKSHDAQSNLLLSLSRIKCTSEVGISLHDYTTKLNTSTALFKKRQFLLHFFFLFALRDNFHARKNLLHMICLLDAKVIKLMNSDFFLVNMLTRDE